MEWRRTAETEISRFVAAEPTARAWPARQKWFGARGASRPSQRTSMGVILCRRRDPANGKLEVLLVRKRCTYAFADFVLGRYDTSESGVSELLDQMTHEELLDVVSLNFEQMWYRLWLSRGSRDAFPRRQAKFLATFGDGVRLRELAARSRGRGALLGEVPKGRRDSPREAGVACAVRELQEETGIEKSEYRLLPDARRVVGYVSNGTRYVGIYYIAIAHPHLSNVDRPRDRVRGIRELGEIGEARWFDIEHLRLLETTDGPATKSAPGRLETTIAPAFRLARTYLRGRWDRRREPLPRPAHVELPRDADPRSQ